MLNIMTNKFLFLFSSCSSLFFLIFVILILWWFFLRKKHYYISSDNPNKLIEINIKDIPDEGELVLKNVKELYFIASKIPKDRLYIIEYKCKGISNTRGGECQNVGDSIKKLLKQEKDDDKKELYIDFTKNELKIQDVKISRVVY